MLTRLFCATFLLASIAIWAVQPPEPPLKKPVDPNNAQVARIREGISLHEQKKYQDALAIYASVLSESPDCAVALHEMAFTYFALKDYEHCLDIALKGSSYQSEALPRFYTIAGNALSNLGRSEEALLFYSKAVGSKDADFEAYYNYSVELAKAKRLPEATEMAEKCALLQPDYGSNHLSLALLYHDQGRNMESLFACCRFLELEPNTTRSSLAAQLSLDLFSSFVTKTEHDPATNKDAILMPSGIPNDLPNCRITLILATTMMLKQLKQQATQSKAIEGVYVLSFESLAKDSPAGRPEFPLRFYGPYFKTMAKKHFVEAFCNYAYQNSHPQDYETWCKVPSNERLLSEYERWSKNYDWPRH
jgi:tetratricopeptide (TPR) repeat protein